VDCEFGFSIPKSEIRNNKTPPGFKVKGGYHIFKYLWNRSAVRF